jgi:predicted DsbA family dithiol-disulfide isomerase
MGDFIDKVKDAVSGGGGAPNIDDVMSKAQAQGLDQDKVRELLSGFTDEKGNIDWEGALAKAQEMGLDAEKIKSLVT